MEPAGYVERPGKTTLSPQFYMHVKLTVVSYCQLRRLSAITGCGLRICKLGLISAGSAYPIQSFFKRGHSSCAQQPTCRGDKTDEQRQMLLALLMERFQLRFHREQKEGEEYLFAKGPREPTFTPPKHPKYRMFFAGLLGGGNATVC
jgi:hypothetical protein